MRSIIVAIALATLCAANTPGFDPYATLGITRDADEGTIKRAYRRLSARLHPDRNMNDVAGATAKMAEVTRAYEVLSDPAARVALESGSFRSYDEWRASGGGSNVPSNGGSGSPAYAGFFAVDGPVQPLDRARFMSLLRDRSRPIILMFYATWCVHCQHFAPHYRRVALELGDTAVVAAFNCASDEQLCASEQIPGYPTARLLLPDGSVETFQGPLDAAEPVLQWVAESMSQDLVKLGGQGEFRRRVTSSNETWLVAFSGGPWCPPCGAIKGILRRVATRLKGRVAVGIVDCDSQRALCDSFGVNMYPLVRLFAGTPSGRGSGRDMVLSQEAMMFPPAAALEVAATVLEAVLPAVGTDGGAGGGSAGGGGGGSESGHEFEHDEL